MKVNHTYILSAISALLCVFSLAGSAIIFFRIYLEVVNFGSALNKPIAPDATLDDKMHILHSLDTIQSYATQFTLCIVSAIILGAASIILNSLGAIKMRNELLTKG